MICDPCKRGVHTGEHIQLVRAREGTYAVWPPIALEVCKGGTWCDCQHRTTAREAAKRVLERDRELLERLAR
jgi:hypothetical protein